MRGHGEGKAMGTGLVLEGLTVYRGRLRVLEKVSLGLGAGEMVCIAGMNGAGKTTLFQAVMGLCPAAGGRMRYGGRDLGGLTVAERRALGMALVPEGRHVFPGLTVWENLLLGGYRTQAPALRARELCRQFPVLGRARRRAAGLLSGGEQQQLALARALMGRPSCLLLDEPTMGLSPKLTAQVFADLERLRGEGVALLVSSQRLDQLTGKADRVYRLEGGRLELEGQSRVLSQANRARGREERGKSLGM